MSVPTRDQWILMAMQAFRLGMMDGDVGGLSSPRDSEKVAEACIAGFTRTILERKKIRQVYGAGFDIARGQCRST